MRNQHNSSIGRAGNVCGAPPQTALKPVIGELENRQTERFL